MAVSSFTNNQSFIYVKVFVTVFVLVINVLTIGWLVG